MGKLAITGGNAVCKAASFARWPVHSDSELSAVKEVLESGNWGGQPFPGKFSTQFAAKFSALHTAQYAQPVNTGTVAIQASLKAVGVQPGDEVLVPAYTWDGTVGPVLLVNAVPVFVDIDPDTYCMNPALIEQAITPRTRVIMPVHLAMRLADLDAITSIAKKHNLKVVEDCAHVHGAMWKDKGAGSVGDIGAFSFQSSKLMTSGEGGCVITNNQEYFERVQSYINAGRYSVTNKFKHRVLGFNYRLTELQAAVLCAQADRLPEQQRVRQANVDSFEASLRGLPGLSFLRAEPRMTRSAPYAYVLKYRSELAKDIPRTAFVAALQEEGVPCDGLFYEPVYRSSLFRPDPKEFPAFSWGREIPVDLRSLYHCEAAERAAYHEAVWFPHHLYLSAKGEVDKIVHAITKVLENIEELRNLEHPKIAAQSVCRADRDR